MANSRPAGEACVAPTFCAVAKSAAVTGSAAAIPRWAVMAASMALVFTSGWVACATMSSFTGTSAVAVICRAVASTKNRMPANRPTASARPKR